MRRTGPNWPGWALSPGAGACGVCPWTLFFGDTEEGTRTRIQAHIAGEHGDLIRVWEHSGPARPLLHEVQADLEVGSR